MFDYRFNN